LLYRSRDTSPLSLLGRGAGGEGPKAQTSSEPLTGLSTCALSLTLSPGGRGNCSAWSATSEVVAGLCLPTELPDSAINAFRQDVQSEHTSPLSLLGRGAGGEGPRPQTNTELLTGLRTCALSLTLSPGGRGNLWDSARSLSRLLFLWAFILHGLLLELRQGIPFQVNELVHQAGGYLEVGGQLRAFYHVVVPIFRFAKLVADCLAVALQVQGQHRLFQAILGLRLGS